MRNNLAQFCYDSAFIGLLQASERIRRNNSENITEKFHPYLVRSLMVRVVPPKPLAIAIALTLCACATQTPVTGVIVDTRSARVAGRCHDGGARESQESGPTYNEDREFEGGVERMIMEQGQDDRMPDSALQPHLSHRI